MIGRSGTLVTKAQGPTIMGLLELELSQYGTYSISAGTTYAITLSLWVQQTSSSPLTSNTGTKM